MQRGKCLGKGIGGPTAASTAVFLAALALLSTCTVGASRPDYSPLELSRQSQAAAFAWLRGMQYDPFENTSGNQTESDPGGFFFSKLLFPTPSVNGVTSSLEQPALSWAWGESHGKTFTVVLGKANADCPDDEAFFSEVAPPDVHFDFDFTISNGTTVPHRTKSFGPEAPSPMPLPFSQAEFDLAQPHAKNKTFMQVQSSLNGTIIFHYKEVATTHAYLCQSFPDGSSGCGCHSTSFSTLKDMPKHSYSNISFQIETGAVKFVLLSPPSFESQTHNSSVVLLVFSNRNLSYFSISRQHGQEPLWESSLANYSSATGPLGIAQAFASQTTLVLGTSTQGNGAYALNTSEYFGMESGLENDTSAYAYATAYTLDMQDALQQGQLNVTASDLFGRQFNSSFNLSTAVPTALYLNCTMANGTIRVAAAILTLGNKPVKGATIHFETPAENTSCETNDDGFCSGELRQKGFVYAFFVPRGDFYPAYSSCYVPSQNQANYAGAVGFGAACLMAALALMFLKNK